MGKAYIFPGQGAQRVGMGKALFERYPEVEAEASTILGYSLRQLCLEDPQRQLGQTQYTQPALYVVNALHYRQHLEDGGQSPDYAAGHSLGEYNTLQAAGAFDFVTGLRLVQKRGELMGRVSGGGMLAVIGLHPLRVQEILDEAQSDSVDIANFNTYEQVVLAGPREALDLAAPRFEAAGARHTMPLNVSAPFHSRYMAEAARDFAAFLASFTFNPPRFPVIANCHALPYDTDIHTPLGQQIDRPVRWIECIEYLLRQGARQFQEIGAGQVLLPMIQKIRDQSAFAGVTEPA